MSSPSKRTLSQRVSVKKWAAKNPDKRKVIRRRYKLKKVYGLTPGQHKQMYVAQNGCCAICGIPIDYKDVQTDHNHFTGEVRGLLCTNCNWGIGHLRADEKGTTNFVNTINYLTKIERI